MIFIHMEMCENYTTKTIPYGSGSTVESIKIPKKSVSEIFEFKTQPYYVFGRSESGKTTLCNDIFHIYSKECSNMYFFTSTKGSARDNSVEQIPWIYRREPTITNIANVWREIKSMHDDSQLGAETFDKAFKVVATILKNNRLNGDKIVHDMMTYVDDETKRVYAERYKYYTDNKIYPDDSKNKQHADLDSRAFSVETRSRLILDIVNKYGMPGGATNEEISLIRLFISGQQKTLLIFDDVSAAITAMSTDNSLVMVPGSDGVIKTEKGRNAFKCIFMDMNTRCRHYNILIVMFLHGIDVLKDMDKGKLLNVIVSDPTVMTPLGNIRSMDKGILTFMSNAVVECVSPEKYPYQFLYFRTDKLCKSGVFRASLHSVVDDNLVLAPVNERFLKLVNSLNTGANYSDGRSLTVGEEDEYEYYDDEPENTEALIGSII